jgi:ELWxxDGT repeat protein
LILIKYGVQAVLHGRDGMLRRLLAFLAIPTLLALTLAPPPAATAIGAGSGSFLSLGSPQMLLDINPGAQGSGAGDFVRAGTNVFFDAGDGIHGGELWATDGSSAGTHMVDDINAGGSSRPQWLTPLAGHLYFWADDGIHGIEPWTSDGTPGGTHILKDIYPGAGSSGANFSEMRTAGGILFFEADDGVHRDELWKSNGTAGGTVMVKNIKDDPFPHDLTPVGTHLYFATYKPTGTSELWITDGTAAGTKPLRAVSDVSDVAKWKGGVIFSGHLSNGHPVLWKSDGTRLGTTLLVDLASKGARYEPYSLTVAGHLLFFQTDTGLWRTNGTAAGTERLLSFNIHTPAAWLTPVGDILFFSCCGPARYAEPFKSNGTKRGTVEVKDILPGYRGSDPSSFVDVNGIAYFSANDGGTHGREIWKSDGTRRGTKLAWDINPGAASSSPTGLAYLGGLLFFSAIDTVDGREPWAA